MDEPENEPSSPEEWAALLCRNWTERSYAERRDHYVASLPPGSGPAAWDRQARIDVQTLFWGLDPGRTADWHVLELGCGVGRLAAPILERAASYTGFDIATGMVEEARRRLESDPRARFFLGDGLRVPEEATDRRYELALSHAVLIHCPLDVIASMLASAWELLTGGGELRVQLLADPEDPGGITAVEAAVTDHEEAVVIDRDEEQISDPLVVDRYYMGHAFRHAEVEPFLERTLPGAELQVIRPTLTHVYAIARRPLDPVAGNSAAQGS
ncbi:MAG: class I SAM-dependent methyltransferase [Planctomycetota bacterium]|jgi:SAM-dependent methyltransferase